jgi:SAM-dependent methyltransferase
MYFCNFRNRLAQFRLEINDQAYWEERWARHRIEEVLPAYGRGKLDEFEEIFTRYLPHDLPILEAGCGLGQFVVALAHRGYRIEGVDYAAQTICRLRMITPELNVRVGDVYQLDVPDGTYGGYISIGVFEHNPDDPLKGLQEARRVLHRHGVAIIAVPYLNPERQKCLRQVPVAEDARLPNGLRFYQYYFSRDEFEGFVAKAGLETIEVFPYSVYSGLTRDFASGRWLHNHSFFYWRLNRQIIRWCQKAPMWIRWKWAHMLMFICKRVG